MSIKLTFSKNYIFLAINKTTFNNRIVINNTNEDKNVLSSLNKIFSRSFSINLNKDYYKILGITPDASEKDIKTAYINLVKKYHPDVTGGESTEYFKEISNSFKVLSDKSSKNFYDANSEKVSRYYYSTTAFDSTYKNSNKNNNNNHENGFYQYYESNDQSKSDFYSKYNNKEYYRYKDSYQGSHSNYYQDNKGNGVYRKFNNLELSDIANDYRLFLPKILMFVSLYLLCYLVTCKTKNEYHLFIA